MKFKIKNVRFYISFPFTALIAFALTSNPDGCYFLSLISAFFHEVGHLTAMLFCGGKVTDIKLTVFDFKIVDKNINKRTILNDIIITSMGCVFNYLLALICLFFQKSTFINNLIICNLLIGTFNLLPINSLDGGRLFLLVLNRFDRELAMKILFIFSLISLLPLFVVGIIIVIKASSNYSLLIVSCYLLLLVLLKKDEV